MTESRLPTMPCRLQVNQVRVNAAADRTLGFYPPCAELEPFWTRLKTDLNLFVISRWCRSGNQPPREPGRQVSSALLLVWLLPPCVCLRRAVFPKEFLIFLAVNTGASFKCNSPIKEWTHWLICIKLKLRQSSESFGEQVWISVRDAAHARL